MRGAERVLRVSAQRGDGDVTLLWGICAHGVISPCLTGSYIPSQTLYLLPRDEGGLYNDLNYRLLRSFR